MTSINVLMYRPRALLSPTGAFVVAFLLLSGFLSGVQAQDAAVATYRNPVIHGDFADPTIIRVGDVYYATGTSSEWAPHYPLFTSKDLVNWEQIGHVFDKLPDWASASFWAPELFHSNGTFYVYYTARRKSDNISVVGVATSTDPRNGFTDHGVIVEWGKEAIDGFAFRDNDGKLYLSWKAYGLDRDRPVAIMASEMTPDGLSLKGKPFELRTTAGSPISAEGQVMMRRGDTYYLLYSTRGCCGRGCDYQLEVARTKDLRGPWETFSGNPILAGGDEWLCPGHGTMVSVPDGRDFFLYHAYHAQDFVYTGRQGLLDEVRWSEDGWPYFAFGRIPTAQAPTPFNTEVPFAPKDFDDAFDSERRAMPWQWDLRNPPEVRIEGGTLILGVSEKAAESPARAFIGVRPAAGDYVVTAVLGPNATAPQGVAAYGDGSHAFGLSVEGANLVLWTINKGQREQLAVETPGSTEHLHLRMTVRGGSRYRFAWSKDGKDWQPVRDRRTGMAEVNGDFLPPWDRAARVGLAVGGNAGDTGRFDHFEIRYGTR